MHTKSHSAWPVKFANPSQVRLKSRIIGFKFESGLSGSTVIGARLAPWPTRQSRRSKKLYIAYIPDNRRLNGAESSASEFLANVAVIMIANAH